MQLQADALFLAFGDREDLPLQLAPTADLLLQPEVVCGKPMRGGRAAFVDG